MPHRVALFQLDEEIKDPVPLNLLPVVVRVHAVQKSEIRIIGFQQLLLPRKGLSYGIEIARPAVFARAVIHRAEMELKEHPIPHALYGTAERLVDGGAACAQVKEIDAVFHSFPYHRFDLLGRRFLDAAHAQTQCADLLVSVRQFSIFHHFFSNSPATSFRRFRMGRC